MAALGGTAQVQALFSFISEVKVFSSSVWVFLVHLALWVTAASSV